MHNKWQKTIIEIAHFLIYWDCTYNIHEDVARYINEIVTKITYLKQEII